MEAEIIFVDKKLKEEYESLEESTEFRWLYKSLNRAFGVITKTPSVGIPLKKYSIPSGWRLLYSLGRDKIKIMALVLEWCDHDSYQKKYSGKK